MVHPSLSCAANPVVSLASKLWHIPLDRPRALQTSHQHVNKLPLGAGAIVGHPFGIDREAMAEELGFEGIINNSTAAVADRDFVVEAL